MGILRMKVRGMVRVGVRVSSSVLSGSGLGLGSQLGLGLQTGLGLGVGIRARKKGSARAPTEPE